LNADSDAAPLESAAFPPFVRYASITLMGALFIGAVMTSGQLQQVTWTTSSLFLFGAAWVCIAWFGYWLLHSRTRLEGSVLTQTWLWDKRVTTLEVASMKLVHWPVFDAVMAPRLFVRQRNGAMTWFQAADARILQRFIERVARDQTQPPAP
jgi:branched-subunit amino acid transport protein